MNLLKLTILLAALVSASLCRELTQVDDKQLMHLIKSEDNVIVLFTKPHCDKCDNMENVVENLETEFNDNLQAKVVKVANSQMVGIYDPTREPALVYFRRGLPLLYGDDNLDEFRIMDVFTNSREPVVKELTDETFEHLTQASTGATTGDWFVFFYSSDCVSCGRMFALWEYVGAALKRSLNVARVNRLQSGIATGKRFGVRSSPEFIYIRQGNVYRFRPKESNMFEANTFVDFAKNIHNTKIKPEKVPAVPNPISEFLSDNPILSLNNGITLYIGAASLVVGLLALFLKKVFTKKVEVTKKE